jgi:hypothetical protein
MIGINSVAINGFKHMAPKKYGAIYDLTIKKPYSLFKCN